MAIQITRQEVLNNLIRFKENLLSKRTEAHLPQRVYTAFINRSTGEIQFAERIESAYSLERKRSGWQEIHFVVEDTPKTIHFQLTDPSGSALKPIELDPLAIRILFETLNVLNELASQYFRSAGTLPEKAVLQHISSLHVAEDLESIESMPGWHGSLNRLEAEKKLFGRPIGTYLLREGEWGDAVARAFAETNKMQVKAYALTFVEGKEKISDRLLLKTARGWTIACDNSDLSSPVYEYHTSLSALLKAGDGFKNPLEA